MYVLILAAGNSSRFNAIKQLAHFNGSTLLQRCIDLGERVGGDKLTVVLGGHFEQIKPHLNPNTHYVYNTNWQAGLGSSIKIGLQQLPKNTDSVLLLLADQPLITVRQIYQLIEKFDGFNPACASYANTYGVPAIFPASFFDQLKTLDDHSGAKKILKSNETSLTFVDIKEAQFDIDYQQDLKNIRTQKGNTLCNSI